MNISSTFTPARELQTRTDGAGYAFTRPGSIGDLSPAILAQLVEAKVGRVNGPRGVPEDDQVRVTNMPQGGDEAVGRDAAMMRALTGRRKPIRYSYQFTAPNQWAGNAPVLPMQTGIQGTEGEDFILEGGDARALANFSRGGGEGSSPADDPRMRALVAQQEAARRPVGSLIGSALGRGVRR